MSMLLHKFSEQLMRAAPRAITSVKPQGWDLVATTTPKDLLPSLFFLKNSSMSQFHGLIDIVGADYPDRADRFELTYVLLSYQYKTRMLLRTTANETTIVPSAVDVFPSADWHEREVWDMYGIYFGGHPNLRRILTDYGFEGHPLRKDFPLTGYVETRYDATLGRIVYEPVELAQEYRDFSFNSPWTKIGEELPTAIESGKKE